MTEHRWRTSTYSTDQGNCVEVALSPTHVYLRDSKDRDGGTINVPREEWRALLAKATSSQA